MSYTQSAYVECLPATTKSTGNMFDAASVTLASVLSATDRVKNLLDFRLAVTSGTPTGNGAIMLIRWEGDSTNSAPEPTYAYHPKEVGGFNLLPGLITGTQYYYFRGVPNEDPNDRFKLINEAGDTLTASLSVSVRDYA